LSGQNEPVWDQLSIETPELVGIDMQVAGLGSRFVALLVDYIIWLIALITLIVIVSYVDPSLSHFSELGEKWATAIVIFLLFLWYWGYFTLFEAFWNGRTPGKRIVKIRVIQRSGRGIGLFEAMTRNLLRIVDQFPFIYVIGVISILVTRQHQRLGDLAAGTLVVHEQQQLTDSSSSSNGRSFTAGLFDPVPDTTSFPNRAPASMGLSSSGVQRLGISDLEVLEGFFDRRLDFTMETRAALAQRIATAICTKSGLNIPDGVSTESFLEELAHQLRDLARIQ
jgi:uncharacterized RDD family membrane protein YckC